jgi:cytidine deaminase
MEAEHSEIVIGLVTPIGTETSELADRVRGELSKFAYTTVVIKISDLLGSSPLVVGEPEDVRVRRLISAGDDLCRRNITDDHPHGDPATLARLAVREIRLARLSLLRAAGETEDADKLTKEHPRTAYVLHSLKRTAEVELLREIYADQFVLIGSQGSRQQREENLLSRPIAASTDEERLSVVRDLIKLDANEEETCGQKMNDTYPLADFFLRDNEVERAVRLLFGEPIEPDIGEFAMYIARASRARSLAASRKVGAAVVVGGSVISTGFNEVPTGHAPDVLQGTDASERAKRANVLDTLVHLRDAGLLNPEAADADDDLLLDKAMAALKGGELLNVIEYQRAVHAEASAIDDATVRGVSPAGGDLYVTTYPCHLCYKHALSVHLARVFYIEPYAKSRATAMYPDGSDDRLIPYAGVAPKRYIDVFDKRAAPVSDPDGMFKEIDRRVAVPLLGFVRNTDERATQERLAVHGLLEELQ